MASGGLVGDRGLVALGLEGDALSQPLVYPGRVPEEDGLLVDGRYLRVVPALGVAVGGWSVEVDGLRRGLDDFLRGLGAEPMGARLPVVAIGSNGSPAQMRVKFERAGQRGVLPMTRARVSGLRAGVSAYVSKPGYLPATPVLEAAVVSSLMVLWLDDAQLGVVDATEPNYHRRRVPRAHAVTLASGVEVRSSHCYVSRHGCLVDGHGVPVRLRRQRSLITELLADVPGLRERCGTTPEEWLIRVRDVEIREHVRCTLRAVGRAVDHDLFASGH